MSNDILDKGSPGRRIILLLTLLLLLISALIFLFNRASFLGSGKKSTEPVVITPDGAVKTFPDDSQKNGEMPAAKVYDMLQKTPPAANTATNKKPNSVKDIVDNSAGKPATGQATPPAPATPNNKPATSTTTAAQKPNDKPTKAAVNNTAKPTANNTANNAANKPAAKPTASVADLVSSNDGNGKPSQATKGEKKPADKTASTATTKPADKTASTATTKPAAKPADKTAATNVASNVASNVVNQPGKYVLQLASFTDEATAQKYLNSIKPRLDKIISGNGIGFRVGTAVLSTGQRVYRSQVVGFQTKEQANEACEKIKSQLSTSAKPDCLVLKSS